LVTGWVLLVQPMVSAARIAAHSDIGFCMGAKVLISATFRKAKTGLNKIYFSTFSKPHARLLPDETGCIFLAYYFSVYPKQKL
jgi:hypothetical protein